MDLKIAAYSIVGAILIHILAADLHALIPRACAWLIRRAAKMLPESEADHRREEWLSHLAECNTSLGAMSHAVGCHCAVPALLKLALPEGEFIEIHLDEGKVFRLDAPTAYHALMLVYTRFPQRRTGIRKAEHFLYHKIPTIFSFLYEGRRIWDGPTDVTRLRSIYEYLAESTEEVPVSVVFKLPKFEETFDIAANYAETDVA